MSESLRVFLGSKGKGGEDNYDLFLLGIEAQKNGFKLFGESDEAMAIIQKKVPDFMVIRGGWIGRCVAWLTDGCIELGVSKILVDLPNCRHENETGIGNSLIISYRAHVLFQSMDHPYSDRVFVLPRMKRLKDVQI